ncbi:hypothetical protein K523DRAFT_365447 [Schizophyllum commune Tattone D]|nr:hypothetical protein K523DRAFT_365447 [Schizophyllum commune Tattone D]
MSQADKTELENVLYLFLAISLKKPDAPSPHTALARLKASLSWGQLFRNFDMGPPQRRPGRPPLRLPASATQLARQELKRYALLCSEVDALRLSKYPSRMWDSLYAVAPVVMQWVDFLHPMNRNIMPVEDFVPYAHDIGLLFKMILDGLVRPRITAEDRSLRSWLSSSRLDVYLVDLWIHLPRYVPAPPDEMISGMLRWMYMFCLCLPLSSGGFPESPSISPEMGRIVASCVKGRPRRLYRAISYYAQAVRTMEPELSEDLYELAYHLMTDCAELAPRSVPDASVADVIAAMSYAIDTQAWKVAVDACLFLQHLWMFASSYRIYEVSIKAGLFDAMVRMIEAVPQTENELQVKITAMIRGLTRIFNYWRPFLAFHVANGPTLLKDEARLTTLHEAFEDLAFAYKERYPSLDIVQQQRRAMRMHCQGCCTDKEEDGSCCKRAGATRMLRCGRCENAFYCSEDCRNKDWRGKHSAVCRAPTGWMNARDMALIGDVSMAYLHANVRAVIAEVSTRDPDRRHHCDIIVLLVGHKSGHVVGDLDECESGPRICSIYCVWEDGPERRFGPVESTPMVGLEYRDLQGQLAKYPTELLQGMDSERNLSVSSEERRDTLDRRNKEMLKVRKLQERLKVVEEEIKALANDIRDLST